MPNAEIAPDPQQRWRLVEPARLARVSAQQVRNYLDMGVLPPVERTANGYRAFTTHHADALITTRALAAGHGWRRATIMSSIHRGDIGSALAAIDDSHAELAGERVHIALAAQASAAADPAPATRRAARIGELVRDIGVRPPVLRLWEKRGLLRPRRDSANGHRVFDAAEQRTAHLATVLRRGNYPFTIVQAVIDTLRSTGDAHRALAELARRDEDLHRQGRQGRQSHQRPHGSAALLTYLDHYAPPREVMGDSAR